MSGNPVNLVPPPSVGLDVDLSDPGNPDVGRVTEQQAG